MTTRLAPAYLVVGDDPYLAGEAVEQILGETSHLSVAEFGPASEPGEILQALRTPSMFGDRRVVVIRDADQFGSGVLAEIVSCLEDPSPDVAAILLSSKPLAKVAAAVKKVGRVIEAGKGKRTDLFGWLRGQAKARNLKVGGDGLGALVEAVGEERMALAHALDELALALGRGATLGPQEVRRQFAGRAETKLFGFVDAVAARETGPALESLHFLLLHGESPQAIFWALARHFRMLLVADGAPAKVAQELGIQPWRAEKLLRQARGFVPGELSRAYRALAEADRKMKASEEPEELTLERTVVAITGG